MANTKVAYLITKLELGGAQKSVLYSAQHLPTEKFEVYLLCGRGGYLDSFAKKNIKNLFFIEDMQRPLAPAKDLRAFWQTLKILKEIKPDIVHTNSSKAGVLGRLAAAVLNLKNIGRKQKIKIVHTVHGFAFYEGQNTLKRALYIFIERFLAKFTHALIFVSKRDLAQALQLKITEQKKCRLIRAGVEIKTKNDFPPDLKEQKLAELGLAKDTPLILCGANLKPQKNPLDMVRAAKIVCAANPACVFLYLGEGELKAKTLALIEELGLQKNFILIGRREDVPALMFCARVFALSSLWEGLPMAAVEALALQTPCACYDAGGLNEVIKNGQNGFIVARGDYRGLAQAILKILDGGIIFDERATDLKEFDINYMVELQSRLYLNFLNGGI